MTLIAITNPSDESAQAGFVHTQGGVITVESIIPEYGDKIEDGAQIVIVDDSFPTINVWQYIAERCGDEVWLHVNNTARLYVDIDDVGPVVAQGTLTAPEPEVELETFTVFGENDDAEAFRAVVTAASPAAAKAAGTAAGLVDEGCEDMVRVDAVLKGDVSEADVTPEANEG